jgi:hypothetical protein
VDNLSLDLTNGLLIPNHKVGGGQDTLETPLATRFEGKGSFQVNFDDWTYFDQYRTITDVELEAVYTTTEHIGATAVDYVLTITLPKIVIENPVPSVGGPDMLKQTISFNTHAGTYDTHETPVVMVLRCGTSYA